VTEFQYWYVNDNGSYISSTGQVHRGIHQGALGILDGYNLRPYLLKLWGRGYVTTIVGHSLGAGTAALIAAELRNSCRENAFDGTLTSIKAVVFSSPAIVTDNLATAFVQSELLVNVIYGNDIVPRISKRNMATLAKEIIEFGDSHLSAEWAKADRSDLANYFTNLGKAAAIKHQKNEESSANNDDSKKVENLGDDSCLPNAVVVEDAASSVPETSISALESVVDTVATENEKKQLELEAFKAAAVVLLPPGPIAFIFKEITGAYETCVLSHRHQTFARMELMLEHAVEDHRMFTYRKALEAARFRTRYLSQYKQQEKQQQDELTHPSIHRLRASCSIKAELLLRKSSIVSKESRTRQSILADGVKSDSIFSSSTSTSSQIWRNCSVCELDVAWPYMMHSDANRATVTHNCSKCHAVVCTLCAPVGDKIPGDGLNQSIQLRDLRIALPNMGVFEPQRVCIPCYFESNTTISLP